MGQTSSKAQGQGQLAKGLRQRHLTMIGIGGVIGAGLFVGSGVVINEIGPAAILTYVLAGVLVVLCMRMLGEMAAACPTSGSFTEYARRALGGWAGFSMAWLYWYFWVIVVGFEAVAGAKILDRWVDGPLWLLALALLVALTVTNLISVRSYGEFEYWFASIKVATIMVFLALGVLYVVGLWPNHGFDLSNLTTHGGFFPNGLTPMLSGIVVVILSLIGAEIVTIAAAESAEPQRAVVKATNAVVVRILIFFVGSITLLVTILPWNSTEVGGSPYVAALETMGIPYAADVMNLVVLTAVLSCLNSGLYTASRMLFVLAARSEAPRRLLDVTRRGVPVNAILTSTVVGYVCVIAAYLWPKTVFMFLLNSSGAIALFVYLLIAMSELRLRKQIEASAPETLRVKMWFYPWLTYATILGIGVVVVSMFVLADARSQAVLSSLAWLVTVVAYAAFRKRIAAGSRPAVAVVGDPSAPSAVEVAEVESVLAEVPEQRRSAQRLPELVPAGEPTR
jgi:GABA permease